MAVAFLREAEAVLKDGGYEYQRKSGKSHGIWKHPDAARPLIQVPGTPRDPDHALIRLRRAVRVGSTPHIPQGLEADMKQSHKQHTPLQRSLAEQLVLHAPAGLKRRAAAAQETGKPERATPKLTAEWLRKCVQSHGALPNHDLNTAAEQLFLSSSHVSAARVAIGALTYKTADAAGPNDPSYTDFSARMPEGAFRLGRAAGSANKKARRPVEPVKTSVMPTDPDEARGRRLDQGGLTDDQHAEAERLMRESTERADREASEIRARLDAGFVTGSREVAVAPVAEESNGKRKSQLEIAMEMMREAALADTHALTDDDIMMLRGTADNLKRMQSDLQGMSAGINLLLKRVATREGAAA